MIYSILFATAIAATCPFTRVPDPPLHVKRIWETTNNVAYNSVMIGNAQQGVLGSSSKEVLFGNFEAMYSTIDGAKSFQNLKLPAGTNSWAGFKTSAGTYLVDSPDALFRKVNGSATWTKPTLPKVFGAPISSTGFNALIEANKQIVWGTQSGIYVSRNDGQTWSLVNCTSLIKLAVNSNTVSTCSDIFVRGMLYSPTDNRIIFAIGSVGLTGIYSLQLPIPATAGPTWRKVFGSQICDLPPQSDGTTLCTDHGPMVLVGSNLYVQTGRNIAKVPYPNGATSPKNYVYSSPTDETAVGIGASGTSIVALFFSRVVKSANGGAFQEIDTSACSKGFTALFPPTMPEIYGNGVAPLPQFTNKFLIGGQAGPYILTI